MEKTKKGAVTDQNSFYYKLFNHIPDPVFIADAETGQILNANKKALEIIGYPLEEVKKMHQSQLHPPDLNVEVQNVFSQDYKHQNVESEILTAEGLRIPVIISSCHDFDCGNKKYLIGVFHDITGRKLEEIDKQEKELLLSETQKIGRMGSWCLDLETNHLTWTDEVYRIFGIDPGEIETTYEVFLDLVHPEDREVVHKAYIRSLEENMDSYDIEHRIIRKSGEIRYVLEKCIHKRDNSGKIVSSTGMVQDITEKKNYERELRKLNADKNRFIQILAHDLRTPFQALLGFSEIMLADLNHMDKQTLERQLKIQRRSILKTNDLLEDLLLWTRSQLGMLQFEPAEVVLNDILVELLDSLMETAMNKGLSVELPPDDNFIILADPNMLKIILRNLLTNAIKFTDRGGTITIFCEKRDESIVVTVSDTGIGISPEEQKKIWDLAVPFTNPGTDNEKGTGLGLLICKEFVDRHGGTIKVESKPGRGSKFSFILPN